METSAWASRARGGRDISARTPRTFISTIYRSTNATRLSKSLRHTDLLFSPKDCRFPEINDGSLAIPSCRISHTTLQMSQSVIRLTESDWAARTVITMKSKSVRISLFCLTLRSDCTWRIDDRAREIIGLTILQWRATR